MWTRARALMDRFRSIMDCLCRVEDASKIGKVHVDVGDTACKIPPAGAYIQKVIDKGNLGKKKKQARC